MLLQNESYFGKALLLDISILREIFDLNSFFLLYGIGGLAKYRVLIKEQTFFIMIFNYIIFYDLW